MCVYMSVVCVLGTYGVVCASCVLWHVCVGYVLGMCGMLCACVCCGMCVLNLLDMHGVVYVCMLWCVC